MKFLRHLLATAALFTLLCGVGGSALAAEKKCDDCHGDDEMVLPIGKTKHGTTADSRAPACVSCHGTSEGHKKASSKVKPDRTFSKSPSTPVAERNAACLACHDKDAQRSHWSGSTHDARDVACTSCHAIHNGRDKVRDKRTQSEVCFTCHKEQRTQINKPSHHPLVEGKMACSDCHNVHGSTGPKLMKRDSVVETCYTCHMEKRGPFVHSHEPVNEDCSNCHNPHGTTAENMLKTRAPFLCQSCHTPHAAIQPLLAGQSSAAGVAGWNGTAILQGRGCVNCHTQIHGSNTPSSQFLLR
ncbi:MAG: DmsE family decaheme c-type cytochrome [Burkholderiales bacterium]